MAASELASVLSRRRQEVDTRGAFFTKDRSGHADAVWNERTDSQFSPRSSERKSAIARLPSVSPYGSREASPAPGEEPGRRPKILRRMSADATMQTATETTPSALEDRARRSFGPKRASTGPMLKAPIQRLGSARSASPTVPASSNSSNASPRTQGRTQRPPRAKAKALPRRSASAAPEAAPQASPNQPEPVTEPVRTRDMNIPSSDAEPHQTRQVNEASIDFATAAEHKTVASNNAKCEEKCAAAPNAPLESADTCDRDTTNTPGGSLDPSIKAASNGARLTADSSSRDADVAPSTASTAPKGPNTAEGGGTAKSAAKPASKPKSKPVCKPKAKPAIGIDGSHEEMQNVSQRAQLPQAIAKGHALPSSLPTRDLEVSSPTSPRSDCSVATASTISCEATPPPKQQDAKSKCALPKRFPATSSKGADLDLPPRQGSLRLAQSGITGDEELSDLLESDIAGHSTTYDSSRQPSACSNATSATPGLPTILTTAVDKLPSDKQCPPDHSSAAGPSTDSENRSNEPDMPDTDKGPKGPQGPLQDQLLKKLEIDVAEPVEKREALAEPEPAPSPECRSALSTQTVGVPPVDVVHPTSPSAPGSPSFALSPLTPCGAGFGSGMEAEARGVSEAVFVSTSAEVQVVTDPHLWQAVTEGDLCKLQELVATGLLHSGRVADVNRHSIFWNALAFQQIKVALFLLHHFPPGSANGVDITEVHPRRQDTLLHLCLYIHEFSAAAAELFQRLYLGIGTVWNKAALQAYRSRPSTTADTFLHCAAARLNFWVLRYTLSSADAVYLLQHKNGNGHTAFQVLLHKLSEVCRPPSLSPAQAPQESERPLLDFEKYQAKGSQDSKEPAFADVELEVEEDSGEVCRVPAHRAILGAASRVLHEQLLHCAAGRPLRINPLCCHNKKVLLAALAFLYRSQVSCDFSEDGFLLWQLLCFCVEYDMPKPLWRYAKAALLMTISQERFASVLPVLLEARVTVGLDNEEARAVGYALLHHHEVALTGMPIDMQSQVLLSTLAIAEQSVLETSG